MRRILWLLLLSLLACTQPGSGLFYPLGEPRLRAFQGGEGNDFQFLGFDTTDIESDFPVVNGTRREDWSVVDNTDLILPPSSPATLLRWAWRTEFSGWGDLFSFYLTQDEESGALTLHAVGLGIDGNRDEAVYWLDEATLFLPPLADWDSVWKLDTELTRHDNSGAPRERGSLAVSFTPLGIDTAQTPVGRFESLRLKLELAMSATLPNTNSYSSQWTGETWLHPALGMVRYSVEFLRSIGSEYRLLQLDRMELTGSNIPLPAPQ